MEYLISFNEPICNSDSATEEFETVFKFLKRNKAAGIENIGSNIIYNVYNEIKDI